MATVDSLDIQISASAQKASQAIDSLAKSLDKLAGKLKLDTSSLEKLGKIDGNSFRGLGEGVKALSAGLKDLQGVKKTDFNKLASGIERLGAIQPGNMETVGKALRPLADGINILSNARFDNKNLQNLINSLTRLANANVSGLSNVDFTALGNSIKGLATALSGADKVEQNTISMTNAIAKLAAAGANIGSVSSGLPLLGEKLKEFMHTMSDAAKVRDDTIAFTQAVATLASAGNRIKGVTDNLVPLGEQLRKFFEIMSKAPTVSDNVIKMVQALAQLAGAGGRANVSANILSRSIGSLSISMSGLRGSTMKAIKGLESFGKQVLSAMGITLGIYGAIRGIKKSIEISSALTEVQNVVDVTFGDMTEKVEEFASTSIEKLGMSELSVKQYASRFQAMGSAMGINSSLISDANSRLSEMTNGYISASDSMADVSLNLTKLTADMASFYDVEQKAVAEDLAAIFTGQTVPLRQYGLDLTQATLQEWALKHGLDANMKTMSQAEKTMLRYQYVMANTAAAHGDFARTADTWSNQIRILKQNFEQLGKVIGTSFIGFLKPLVQSLNVAISYITVFAETVSNSLGKIFGWKYEKSTGAGGLAGLVGDATDLEDGIGGATDAAKKLKTVVLGIDELNINAPDEGDKDGGAGGAGLGAGGMLGEEAGKWVKDEALLDYESELDTLYKLGEYIGNKLKDALSSIKWEDVYKSAENFGSGLANFLNGLISPELFGALGATAASSINTVLHALDSFGETFEWEEFGKSLGTGLNSFMDTLDWDTALSAASNWGKGIADALNGFLENTDFEEIGATIVKLINTVLTGFNSFAKELEWEKLGKSLISSITGFFKNWDAELTGETFGNFAKGILEAATGALDKLGEDGTFEILGQKLVDFVCGIDWGGLTWDLLKFFDALKEAAYKFPADFAVGIAQNIIEKISGVDISEIDMPEWLEKIPQYFLANPSEKIIMTFEFISNFEEWSTGIQNFWNDHIAPKFSEEKWQELGGNIKTGISTKWTEFTDWWKTTGFYTWWNESVAPWFTFEKWYELGQGILDGLMLKWEEIKTWWNESAIVVWWEEDIAPWFTIEKWSKLANGIKEGIVQKWTETSTQWKTDITKWWNEHVSPWFAKKKWEELFKEIPNVFKNAFKNAANGAIGFLNSVIEGVEKMVNNAIRSLADMARVINKIPGVNIQFETPSISLPRIPQFANGGITLSHTFAEIGELNRPEAILPLSDARAMGMIADSIMENTDYGYSVGNGVLEGNQIEEAIRKGVRDAVAEILTPYLADIVQNTRETADKDMSVNLDGRDLINELDKKNQSLGFDFRTGNSRGRVAF